LYLLAETIFHFYVVVYPRFVVGILIVLFTVSDIQVFPVSAAVSDCRSLWESPSYTQWCSGKYGAGGTLGGLGAESRGRAEAPLKLKAFLFLDIPREGPFFTSPQNFVNEFAMVECRRFVVGMLMVYVIVSEISVLPVSWLPSWIFDTR